MPKHPLSFVELHNPMFMQGSNLGNKINAAQKGAKLFLDDDRDGVWIYFKQKLSFIPLSNVATADMVTIPEDLKETIGLTETLAEEPSPSGPPAIARARRGRPPKDAKIPSNPVTFSQPAVDLDTLSPEERRAAVRAASANAYRPDATQAQNDHLIQEARAQAQGIKLQKTAQVQNAQQVGLAASSVTGKPKPISHAELAALKAKE